MIIVAMDNSVFFNKLKEIYKEDIYEYDIIDMESVLMLINKLKEKYSNLILITKDTLNGRFTKELYIKQIRLISKSIKVILFTELLEDEFKKFLFSNEVFNIIETKVIDIDKVIENINNTDKIVYKNENSNNKIYVKENIIKYNVMQKQVISIFGTSGSGKSYISSIISKLVYDKIKNNLLVLDFDVCNSSIDIFNNLDNNNGNLMKIINDIDLDKDLNKSIEENIVVKNNINYLINNVTIYDYQNKLNELYYERILNYCKSKFDMILLDLPSNPFIDVVPFSLINSDKIFFVVNPNYISLRQALKYLELITKLWDINKNKINLIINKITKDSLSIVQIEGILSGYKNILEINYDKKLEATINGSNYSLINQNINCDNLFKELGIFVENINVKDKIFNIFKEKKIAYDNKSF